jgi:DNA-binding MarR family transcriptional regulator
MQVSQATLRGEQLHEIADALPQRAAALVRLFFAGSSLSRTEASVLKALEDGPARITELAAAERISQPGITLVVNRLQERGWVSRAADPSDGRAVLVSLTDAGRETIVRQRDAYLALLREGMATLEDADVEALARAVDVLDVLIDRLAELAEQDPHNETRRTRR